MGSVAPSHPNFLAKLRSHAAQFLEPLSDPLHDLLVCCSLAGRQEAIPASKLLFARSLNFFDCRESFHPSILNFRIVPHQYGENLRCGSHDRLTVGYKSGGLAPKLATLNKEPENNLCRAPPARNVEFRPLRRKTTSQDLAPPQKRNILQEEPLRSFKGSKDRDLTRVADTRDAID
jgi:hypothetical protein